MTLIQRLKSLLDFLIPRGWVADRANNRWRRWNGHAFEYREMTDAEREDAMTDWAIR